MRFSHGAFNCVHTIRDRAISVYRICTQYEYVMGDRPLSTTRRAFIPTEINQILLREYNDTPGIHRKYKLYTYIYKLGDRQYRNKSV